MGLDFILILVGVILLFVAAFGISGWRNVNLLALGLALIALTLLTGCDNDRIVDHDYATNVPAENEVIVEENDARPRDEVCRPQAGEVCP